VRLTADCPLVCPELIDLVIESHLNADADYTANCNYRGYPHGFNVEIFKGSLLLEERFVTSESDHIEHVTPLFYKSNTSYNINNVEFDEWEEVGNLRFDVDTPRDLTKINNFLRMISIPHPSFQQLWDARNSLPV
jgi:spore coat polysaccharide biosynthesis protein SpsF